MTDSLALFSGWSFKWTSRKLFMTMFVLWLNHSMSTISIIITHVCGPHGFFDFISSFSAGYFVFLIQTAFVAWDIETHAFSNRLLSSVGLPILIASFVGTSWLVSGGARRYYFCLFVRLHGLAPSLTTWIALVSLYKPDADKLWREREREVKVGHR